MVECSIIISFIQLIMETLNLKVMKLLKSDALLTCRAWLENDQIILEISNQDFEKYMGVFVCRIQNIIDLNLSDRNEDLTIVIRNMDKLLDNTIKIWKPVDYGTIVEK